MAATPSVSAPSFDKLRAYELRIKHRLTYEQISELMGCSRTYAYDLCKEVEEIIGCPDELQAKTSVYPELLNATRLKLLASAASKSADPKANLKEIALAFEKFDKAYRLENGQATANKSVMVHLLSQADSELFDNSGCRAPRVGARQRKAGTESAGQNIQGGAKAGGTGGNSEPASA